jgi:probable rRNA maturation factor
MTTEVLDESGLGLVDVRRTQRLATFVLDRLRVHPQAELCITAVDEETIAELNLKWMEKDGPTDVLAFPMDELRPGKVNEEPEEGVLGDLVLCPAVAVRQAEEAVAKGQAGYTAVAELDMLTVHGILHLLGYDHAEPEEHREMFDLQGRLLDEWRSSAP